MKLKSLKVTHLYLSLCVVLVLFLVHCALKEMSIEMPSSATINERISIKMSASVDARENHSTALAAGILVPKNWKAKENMTMTLYNPSGTNTPINMVLMPDGEKESASGLTWSDAAKNLYKTDQKNIIYDDLEWIVFKSPQVFNFTGGQGKFYFTVDVNLNVGEENMLVSLGFFLVSQSWGLVGNDKDYRVQSFAHPFEVKGGDGDIIDFINPQMSSVVPVKSLDNDLITLKFDAGITSTELENESAIYLKAKAFDNLNQLIGEVNQQLDDNKLFADGGRNFSIDLWPRGFFKVSPTSKIAKIEYYFTDVTGTKVVGYGNTERPFTYNFKCE